MQSTNMMLIYNCLIDEFTYNRIKDLNPDVKMQDNYTYFIEWNKTVINKLSDMDVKFLVVLCDKIRSRNILSMDEEHCINMTCVGFYYTANYKLVIVTPR